MLDQSCYKKADEIIEHYEPMCGLINSHHAGHSGRIPVSACRASDLRCREDRRNRSQGVQRSHLL